MPSKTKRRDAGDGALYRAYRHGCGKSPCGKPADECPRRTSLWTARVELPSGPGNARRQKVIRARDKAVAQAKLKALLAELGRAGDLPTASPTLEVWLRQWLTSPTRKTKVRTTNGYAGYVKRYIIPAIGRVRLDKLAPAHVKHLHKTILDQGLSSTTALQAHRILAKALGDALREGRVTRNVATLVDAPPKALSKREALTVENARALLLSVADDDLHAAMWTVALVGGIRQGERLGITEEFVDLDRRVLTIAWQLQRLTWEHGCGDETAAGWPCGRVRAGYCPQRTVTIPPGHEAKRVYGGLWLVRPKSSAGWREVPMPEILATVLERYLAAHTPGDAGLIFTRPDGHPIDPRKDNAAWDAALRAAGLPDVVGHSARHTANTLLHKLGVDPETRQKIMGHSSAVANATYVHVADPLMRDAMDRLGDQFASPQLEA